MKGKMYTFQKGYDGGREYILVEELENVVALMETDTQNITWVTRNSLKYDWKEKETKQ